MEPKLPKVELYHIYVCILHIHLHTHTGYVCVTHLNSEMRNDKNFYVGDFNFWLNDLNNPQTVEFLDIISLHNYVQGSTHETGNTLDLVITKIDCDN